MNDICKITALILFLLSLSFGQTKKEKEIIKFLNARYNASLDSVSNYLDQNFIYYHIPYVGMGISSELIEDKLTVTSVSPFIKSNKPIKIGDVILEINDLKTNITKNNESIKKIILAKLILNWNNSNITSVNFAIGGAFGNGIKIKRTADKIIALGKLTWPHQMVKMMISEQIYRIETIIQGHPYHK